MYHWAWNERFCWLSGWVVNFGWTRESRQDAPISFEADFSSKLSFKIEIESEDDDVSETRSHVVWSPKHEEEAEGGGSKFSDSVGDNEAETITFDSVCSSSLRCFLLKERKKDYIARRLSGFIFRLD